MSIYARTTILILLLLLTIQKLAISQTIFYVNNQSQNNSNGGTTWDTAFKDLQPALDAASALNNNSQIWIKNGIYKPTEYPAINYLHPLSSRYLAFHFKGSVKIFGGFNGNETSLFQRDSLSNNTILSGDHFGNDSTSRNSSGSTTNIFFTTENSNNILVIDGYNSEIEINSIKFKGSRAWFRDSEAFFYGRYTFYLYSGSAINYLSYGGSNLTKFAIKNVSFESNIGNFGVVYADPYTNTTYKFENLKFSQNSTNGVYPILYFPSNLEISNSTFELNNGTALATSYLPFSNNVKSNLKLTNCIFNNNYGSYDSPGALKIKGTNAIINNCIFLLNYTQNQGGAISSENSNIQIAKCLFSKNRCFGYGDGYGNPGKGGALFINSQSTLTMNSCLLEGNFAKNGGVINNEGNSIIENNIFSFNGSNSVLGSIIYNSNTLTLKKNIFKNNGNQTVSGGVYNTSNNLSTEKNVFFNNLALYGSGIYNNYASPNIFNNLFIANIAYDKGGAIYNYTSSPRIINNSFIGNSSIFGGGGIRNFENFGPSDPQMLNNLFFGNYGSYPTDIFGNQNLTVCKNNASDAIGSPFLQFGSNFLSLINIADTLLFYHPSKTQGLDGNWISNDDGFSLTDNSLLKNAGDSTNIIDDITGNPRSNIPSIGAYESTNNHISNNLKINKGEFYETCLNKNVYLELMGCNSPVKWLGGDLLMKNSNSISVNPQVNTSYLAICDNEIRNIEIRVITSDQTINRTMNLFKESFTSLNTITSSSKILNSIYSQNTRVDFYSGNSILLLPGFEAVKNSNFKAEIKPVCNN